jgi:PTS system nitrogen regulatory IIA component
MGVVNFPSQPLMENLMTAKEVAPWLGIKKNTVNAWAKSGKIPHLRLGRQYRYRRDELEKWLHQKGAIYGKSFIGPRK